MTYTKQTWADNNPSFPASAARFGHMEDGIEAAHAIQVVNEAVNPLDTQYAGGAATDGVSDSTAALQAAITAAVTAPKGRIVIPPYTFRTSVALVATSETFVMEGYGARRSRIQMNGAVDDDVLRVVGGGAGPSGKGRIMDVAFCTDAGTPLATGKAALALQAISKMQIQNCYAFGTDIAFDMRSNCFGTRFIGCASDPALCRVGLLLRGATPAAPFTAGSGSDISVFDCWFGGREAAVWCEPNAGGYHFYGGQMNGGAVPGTVRDDRGSLLLGLGYGTLTTTTADVSIGATTIPVANGATTAIFGSGPVLIGNNYVWYTGRTGDASGGTLTGVTGVTSAIPSGTALINRGRVSNVDLNGVSFEGTTKRHIVRSHAVMDGLSLNEISVGTTGCISVVKCSDAINSILMMRRLAVRGSFTGILPLDISGLSSSWDIQEESPNVVNGATFNGVTMNFQTRPMIEWSGLGTRARAFFGDKVRFGGRSLRWTGTDLESHTDSSSSSGWAAVGGGAAPQTLFIQEVQPTTPPAGSLWIPLDANDVPLDPSQWQVFT